MTEVKISMTETQQRPEVGRSVEANGIRTNYLEAGTGPDVVLIHGSGPGVTAYANWRGVIPELAKDFHVVAPDMVGFGFSDRPEAVQYNVQTWADQTLGVMDALSIEKAHLIGNSFGGAIALRLACQHPGRVDRMVLMGSMGVDFPITEGLDRVWGYTPSFENMRAVLDVFAYSRDLVNDELADVRYRASMQPGFLEAVGSMFPPPRQQQVAAMATPDGELKKLQHRTLVVHGREDQVIPLETSLKLAQLLDNADLNVFSHCGHWSMIERNKEFNRAVRQFLSD